MVNYINSSVHRGGQQSSCPLTIPGWRGRSTVSRTGEKGGMRTVRGYIVIDIFTKGDKILVIFSWTRNNNYYFRFQRLIILESLIILVFSLISFTINWNNKEAEEEDILASTTILTLDSVSSWQWLVNNLFILFYSRYVYS